MRQLEDKVAVVAGGSADIGFVASPRFTEESTILYITGRRRFGKAQLWRSGSGVASHQSFPRQGTTRPRRRHCGARSSRRTSRGHQARACTS